MNDQYDEAFGTTTAVPLNRFGDQPAAVTAVDAAIAADHHCVSCFEPFTDGNGVQLSPDLWRCDLCQARARKEPFVNEHGSPQITDGLTLHTQRGSRNLKMRAVMLRHRLEDRDRIEARLQEKIAQFRAEAQAEIAAEYERECAAIADGPDDSLDPIDLAGQR